MVGDEREFARNLMLAGQGGAGAPAMASAIFGTAGALASTIYPGQPPLRIGLWPLRSPEEPLSASGVFVLLGILLERWPGTRVYRLAARLDDVEPRTLDWSLARSQFTFDDWQLQPLDENVGIQGMLAREGRDWLLTLEIEDDRVDDDEPRPLSLRADSLGALTGALPSFVGHLAHELGAESPPGSAPLWAASDLEHPSLAEALAAAFQLELRLYLQLWGQRWPAADMRATLCDLADLAGDLGDFGTWLGAQSLARWLRYRVELDSVLAEVERWLARFPASESAAILLAQALFASESRDAAFDALEPREEQGSASLRLALAQLAQRDGRPLEALDILQAAIVADTVSAALYRWYGELLLALDATDIEAQELVLVEPNDTLADRQLWEAAAAWEAGLQLEPQNPALLQRLLIQLAELDGEDERLWPAFARLLTLDDGGERISTVLEAFASLEDLSPGIAMLRERHARAPGDLAAGLLLAETLLLAERRAELEALLESLRPLAREADERAALANLRLLAGEPDYELRLGEIAGMLDAGKALRPRDVEWLEELVAREPDLAELMILLARAWLSWEENAAALETLLDGQRRFPHEPGLLVLLAEQLWQAGEMEAALGYLGRGLAENPDHVPLLALCGEALFEDGQDEAARACLLRAETIAPRHPALARARARIAAGLA